MGQECNEKMFHVDTSSMVCGALVGAWFTSGHIDMSFTFRESKCVNEIWTFEWFVRKFSK
jgi:hypothetical protein